MKTIKIVRLERNGIGVFRHRDPEIYKHPIACETYERHNGGGFPLPEYDRIENNSAMDEDYLSINKDNKEWFCAYKTVEQLQDWIYKEEIQYFASVGFKVILLKVSDYQIGEKQVLFTKESIKSQEDITSLFI